MSTPQATQGFKLPWFQVGPGLVLVFNREKLAAKFSEGVSNRHLGQFSGPIFSGKKNNKKNMFYHFVTSKLTISLWPR